MRKIISEKNISRIFHFIALLFFAVLFMVSLFISGYNRVDCADEYVILEKNSLLRIILLTGIFLSIMLIAGFLYDKIFYKWNRYLLIALICMIGFAVSIYWARNNGAAPIADQGMIVAYANALNDGDFNGIKEGRYIARCMQQLGLITVIPIRK